MKVFLLRHGMTARANSDVERALTPEGTAALKDVMSRRPSELSGITRIHTGPMARIQETANIAAQVIGYQGEIVVNQSLDKLSRGQEITATLKDIEMTEGDIILVSHESSLCNLLVYLTGDDVLMSNSSLCAIETTGWTRLDGELVWQESPNSSEIKRTRNFADMF